MNTDNKQGNAEPNPASAGSAKPAAWMIECAPGASSFTDMRHVAMRWPKAEIIPLYRQPPFTFTDAEREAVVRSERWARLEGYVSDAAALRGLLERMG